MHSRVIFLLTLLVLGSNVKAQTKEPSDDILIFSKLLSDLVKSLKCLASGFIPFMGAFIKEVRPAVGDVITAMFGNLPAVIEQLTKIIDSLTNGDSEGVFDAISGLPGVLLNNLGTIPNTFEAGKALLHAIVEAWSKASRVSSAIRC